MKKKNPVFFKIMYQTSPIFKLFFLVKLAFLVTFFWVMLQKLKGAMLSRLKKKIWGFFKIWKSPFWCFLGENPYFWTKNPQNPWMICCLTLSLLLLTSLKNLSRKIHNFDAMLHKVRNKVLIIIAESTNADFSKFIFFLLIFAQWANTWEKV